jgi:hypothetical protein
MAVIITAITRGKTKLNDAKVGIRYKINNVSILSRDLIDSFFFVKKLNKVICWNNIEKTSNGTLFS